MVNFIEFLATRIGSVSFIKQSGGRVLTCLVLILTDRINTSFNPTTQIKKGEKYE